MNSVRARVISQEKGLYRISDGKEERPAEVSGKYRYGANTISDYPAVGDYVIASWPEDGSNSIITDLFPRKSSFIRKAAGKVNQEQVVATNIDTIFICMSLNNDISLRRLERYLSVAWESGATPVVVMTKADLCEDLEGELDRIRSTAIGVDVVAVSSRKDDYSSIDPYLIPGKTIAFMGSSGVGKSTLINKLIGEDRIETNGIRNDDKGRHTTTRRQLILLESGVSVIDTPGMRELGMFDNDGGIDTAFAEIEELTLQCKFSDCSHRGEPGCAIMAALEDGSLEQSRWESYLKLKIENEFVTKGSQYRESKRAKFKEISKINKHKKNKR